HLNEQYADQQLQAYSQSYQQQFTGGQALFRSGTLVPFGLAYVSETTVFREFGPLAGSTMRLAYDVAPKIGPTLSRQTFDGDAGAGWSGSQNFKFATCAAETYPATVDYQKDAQGNYVYNSLGQPIPVIQNKTVSGFRLRDGRASYGMGLETFALGFPVHF